jgi:hypothetical protein
MFGGRRFLRALACVVAVLATVAGACGDDGGGDEDAERATVPTAESTTTTEATTTTEPAPEFEPLLADPALTPEEQVEAAYLYSWEIYLDALRTGRTDYLDVIYVDPSLSGRRDQIESIVADGHTVIGEIEPAVFDMVIVSPTEAVLIDTYVNHLTLANADSGEPIENDPNEQVSYSYTLELSEGSWRVKYVERL